MRETNRIVAIETGSGAPVADEILLTEEVAPDEPVEETASWDDADAGARPRRWDWVPLALTATAVLAWTALFGWAHRNDPLLDADIGNWVVLIRDWSMPVLLVCTVWLLVMRNSTREASRFADAAHALSDESTRLEARLATINGELSIAREFIAAQSRDLESLGRVAADRLSINAGRLEELITDNSAHVETIFTVSTTALENMDKLRAQLPVIATSARDVASNIGNAGRTAHSQLQEMIMGFKRLNEFGQASERQVQTLRKMVDEAISEFTTQGETIERIVKTSFAELANSGPEFRAQLEAQQVQALAAIHEQSRTLVDELKGIARQHEATQAQAMADIREQARTLAEELETISQQRETQQEQALGDIREQASTLADELLAVSQQHQTQEEEALAALDLRLSSLRDDSATIAEALRQGETSAVAAWQQAVAGMDQDIKRISAALANADATAMKLAKSRLSALSEEATRLDTNIAERNRQFAHEMEQRQAKAQERESDAVELLRQRLADIDAETETQIQRQGEHAQNLVAQGENLAARLQELEERISTIVEQGEAASGGLTHGLQALAAHLSASREALTGTDHQIETLTDSSVRLLELIQAGSEHSRDVMAKALSTNRKDLESLVVRIESMRDMVGEASEHSQTLSGHVHNSNEEISAALARLEELHSALVERSGEHAQTLDGLRNTLDAIDAQNANISKHAHDELSAAIEALASKSQEAIAGIERLSGAATAKVSAEIGEEARTALDAAITERMALIADDLEAATARAASASRDAAIQLRDQLAKVNELAGNLERRVSHARQRAEEQVDNDFSRRVALINESLNSHAIDIAKALDTDVSDTAWASYLRGDRGIFTRRAVTLLDAGEARSISQLYESDGHFRDHVSHYIHDFEAMLRQILSTRDGHALGVTLLSSDIGKLYVALAQAIERLRS